jgi:hypothetical protein
MGPVGGSGTGDGFTGSPRIGGAPVSLGAPARRCTLFRLALEEGTAGAKYHGVPFREIAD